MTAVTLPLPTPVVATDRPAGRIAARALRRSLLPGTPGSDVAAELVELAGWRRQPILSAFVRIQRASTDGGSAVVDRAIAYLQLALDLTDVRAPAIA